MNMIVGASVLKIAGATHERRNGLVRVSDRGLRAGQMYIGVSWEPGRSGSSFLPMTGQGAAGESNPCLCGWGFKAAKSLKKGNK